MTTNSPLSARPTLTKLATGAPVSGLRSERIRAVQDELRAWYASGERLAYDPGSRALGHGDGSLQVFTRRDGDIAHAVSFLPGYPDGSSGWASVLPHLSGASTMPKLFLDYVGMGDSDMPSGYRFSTTERTDLVEALWRDLGVRSTTLVAFDISSLVILEHLRRRLEREERGEPEGGPVIRGALIFNGGLFTDGHSHPWWTTPLLRRSGAWMAPALAKGPFAVFMMMAGVMWSRRFPRRDEAGRRVYESLHRHDGFDYLRQASGFVADHKAEGERLDFGRLFMAYRDRFPFLVGGSEEDAFEHRQVDLSQERLARFGLEIARLPGGHMTTDEEPGALADLITRFERENAARPAI
jgi:pimeloyl-ACP methyl ester carboxylesterase